MINIAEGSRHDSSDRRRRSRLSLPTCRRRSTESCRRACRLCCCSGRSRAIARLFERFRGGSLLDKGDLTLHQREIVIDRVAALSGSEYEWGVHIAFFAAKVGLDEAMRARSCAAAPTTPGGPPRTAADTRVRSVPRPMRLDDELWGELATLQRAAMMELLMLAGFYRTVSYLTNALSLPLERDAARFPSRTGRSRMFIRNMKVTMELIADPQHCHRTQGDPCSAMRGRGRAPPRRRASAHWSPRHGCGISPRAIIIWCI